MEQNIYFLFCYLFSITNSIIIFKYSGDDFKVVLLGRSFVRSEIGFLGLGFCYIFLTY